MALAYANEDAAILKNEQEVNVENFKYALELDNSNKQEQEGHLNGEEWVVTGNQAWKSPEGEEVSLKYVADANGFQVISANPPLPTPHPIPEYIVKAIEYINAHGGHE